jgi:hypothetical protein
MARIDWVLVTDLAFFDRHARICMVGVATHLMLPSLPVAIHQLMLVARVIDPLPGEQVEVGVNVLTPSGAWAIADHPDSVHIEVAAEYILVTLRDLPLTAEGTYRFRVHLDEQEPVAVDVPVFVIPDRRYAEVH